jgi:serine phosphatase RsbU (regulator of sigma subunit)
MAVVGGDFYDMFVVGETVVLVVGDVSGKDAAAAAVTGLARHAIRSAAQWAHDPAEVLANLNRTMLFDVGDADIATFCTVLLVFGQRTDSGFQLRLSCAGHPAPLLVDASGHCSELAVEGPPVGWFEDAAFGERRIKLEAGATLVMHTDGLTEARRGGRLLGTDTVREALNGATGSAEEILKRVRALVAAPDVAVSDDIAALAFRAHPHG